MEAGSADLNRNLYFYKSPEIAITDERKQSNHFIKIKPHMDRVVKAGKNDCYILLLQGKPINQPVFQYGPFVMNTRQ
jgi:redox-sensitive bicupin YhaK (pirin superfamily)